MSPEEAAIHIEAQCRDTIAAAPTTTSATPENGAAARSAVATGAPVAGARPACAVEPCALVIFGASGDLTHRKLAPALFRLMQASLVPERFAIVGFSRRPSNDVELRAGIRAALEQRAGSGSAVGDAAAGAGDLDASTWERFAASLHHVRGDFQSPSDFAALRTRLGELDTSAGTGGNRLFYLATPPAAYPQILRGLHDNGLLRAAGSTPWTRVVIEKPFGHDLTGAQELNALVGRVLDERQTFRIDHFLGKETVQNILVFRFGNSLFEPVWNRKYIDRVEITAAETLGVEGRGRFYDGVGVVRDMLQNHLLQVLALVAMELPITFKADDVRDARVQLFRSLRPMLPHEVGDGVVFGQYGGYREEPDVVCDSRTPTYAALKVLIENWRWQGVPFYLRSGKRLAARCTEVVIHFQPIPLCLFGSDDVCRQVQPNVLTLRIQPDEGIALRFASKRPGEELDVASVDMDFSYARAFRQPSHDAYERLLLDALRGDTTLFARRDEIEHCWRFVQPVLDAWERPAADERLPLHAYEPGAQGPAAADALPHRDGRLWSPIAGRTA